MVLITRLLVYNCFVVWFKYFIYAVVQPFQFESVIDSLLLCFPFTPESSNKLILMAVYSPLF